MGEQKSCTTPGVGSWDQIGSSSPLVGRARGTQELTARSDHQDAALTFQDGSTYEGQFLSGKRHGQGTWKSATGQYSGQWRADQQDGEGEQKWQDGRVYVGGLRM